MYTKPTIFKATMFNVQTSQGFTLLELLVTISIVTLISTLVMIAIDPLNMILMARDGTRVNAVDTINKALQSYIVDPNSTISCEELGGCPTDFALTGSDPVSQALIEKHFLKSIPQPPSNPRSANLCDYHLFVFKNPAGEDDYMLRWCFESWNKSDVDNLTNPNYLCVWNDSENIATCVANKIYGIPPGKP